MQRKSTSVQGAAKRNPKSPLVAAIADLAVACNTDVRLTIDEAHAQGYVTATDCAGIAAFGGYAHNSLINMFSRQFKGGKLDRVEVQPRGYAYRAKSNTCP